LHEAHKRWKRNTAAQSNTSLDISAVNDMNKDGKTDLIGDNFMMPAGGYFIFGKDNWPPVLDTNCLRDPSGAHCANQLSAK